MSLSSLPPSAALSLASAKGRSGQAATGSQALTSKTPKGQAAASQVSGANQAVSTSASTPLLAALSTPQARQVSLLSTASYEVSLNSNAGSFTYGNTSERGAQLSSNGGSNAAGISTSSSASVNNVEKVVAPKGLLEGSKNILKFIEQRLAIEQAAGATSEELQALLGQGLSGFKQGFSEAETILGDSSESVSAAVNQLYSEVMDGFEALTKQFVANSDADFDAAASSAAIDEVPAEDDSVTANPQVDNNMVGSANLNQATDQLANSNSAGVFGGNRLSSLSDIIASINGDASELVQDNQLGLLNSDKMVSASIEYRKLNTFSFELVTLDGDKVSIQANSASAYNESLDFTQSADQTSQLQMEKTRSSSEFRVSIDGDIDAQEALAIQQLLDKVLILADEFYNGDVSKAFEKALALDFNQQEITGFAVNLGQVQQFSASAAYQATALAPASATPSSQEKLSELSLLDADTREAFAVISDFVSRVFESLNQRSTSSSLFDTQQLFLNLAEQLDEQNNQAIEDTHRLAFSDSLKSILS
ncbi:MAG: hypothetical protein ACJA1S_001282 [Cellvibrionaceae bacterium]|jgi:hypothetical protein